MSSHRFLHRTNQVRRAVLQVAPAVFMQSLALCWCWLALCAVVHAQLVDSFEGGAPRFQLVESDCQAQLALNEISPSLPRSGQTCELLEIVCSNGTYAYLAAPIE